MRRWHLLLVLLLAVLAGGLWWTDKELKRRDHPGLSVFVRQWLTNYPASFAMEPEQVSIEVDAADLEQLEQVVADARERGVILPEGNSYVKARITHDGRTFKARLRIKGKLSDHVQGSKWSFRVIARKDGGFLGMKRFSLQHPGTRNYLCDWLYHRLSAGEGIIALRYGFCRVLFNGEDLGIYAFEEHFEEELVEHNERLDGPLVRFDPGLFWVHRLNAMQGLRFEEPYAAYQAAALDAYGTGGIEKDPERLRRFEEAVALVDGFRHGELRASEVFDADLIARRHALLDLVGGHHSMDWSDVKYYYDPQARLLEPVAYESFSAFPIRDLAGSWRFHRPARPGDDLHDQLFRDREVFSAYVHHLERMSDPAWLDSAFTALAGALDTASATLYREFPYKELDRTVYYHNQEVVRRSLDVPKAFHAFRGGWSGDTLHVLAVPINSLPMQVDGLLLPGGEVLTPQDDDLLPSRPRSAPGSPVVFRFVLPAGTDTTDLPLVVRCRVLGSSVPRDVEVFGHTLLPWEQVDRAVLAPSNIREFPFILQVDERTLAIAPGHWTLDQDLIVPEGLVLKARAPLRITLTNGARIISRSPIDWQGREDMPVILEREGDGNDVLVVHQARGQSLLRHVRLPALRTYRSDLRVEQVTGLSALTSFAGSLELVDCTFSGGKDQVRTSFTDLRMDRCSLQGSGDDAVTVRGGRAVLSGVSVSDARGIGLKASLGARVEAEGLAVHHAAKGVEGEQGARLTVQGLLTGCGVGVNAAKAHMRHGAVRIELRNMRYEDNVQDHDVGAGSSITLDGRRIGGLGKEGGT